MQQMLSLQGEAAAHAGNLAEGQKVVVNALQERFSETSGVNIDAEMAVLITLQTAYSANARVLTAAREMIDTLLRHVRPAMNTIGMHSSLSRPDAGGHARGPERPAAPVRDRQEGR